MRREKRYVYRCYSADGRLIYVGATCDVAQRLTTHRAGWWGFLIDSVTVKDYPTQAETLAAESHAIATEGPRFNRAGRWATRGDWTVEDYRDHYDAIRFGEWSGYQASRMAKTRVECQHRFGVDIGVETTLKNKETVR